MFKTLLKKYRMLSPKAVGTVLPSRKCILFSVLEIMIRVKFVESIILDFFSLVKSLRTNVGNYQYAIDLRILKISLSRAHLHLLLVKHMCNYFHFLETLV